MKTKNNSPHQVYRDFQDHVSEHHEEGKGMASVLADDNAHSTAFDETSPLHVHTRTLYHLYNGFALALNRLVNLDYKTDNARLDFSRDKETLEEASRRASRLSIDKTTKSRQLEMRPLPIAALIKLLVANTITAILVICDWFFAARSLQVAQLSMGMSLLVGFGLTVGLVVILHFSDRWIATIRDKRARIVTKVTIAAIIIAVFASIIILRLQYSAAHGAVSIGAYLLTVAVVIVVSIALYLNVRFLFIPACRELIQGRVPLKRQFTVWQNAKELKVLNNHKAAIKAEQFETIKDLLTDSSFYNSMREDIIAKYREAIDIYLTEYRRITGKEPYDTYIPDLAFNDVTITFNTESQ